MIASFFINRPIFAAVLSIVITLIGGIALDSLPMAQYPRITPPGVQVSITYPVASAPAVADTVAAPIEQLVNGIEGMLYMSSQMGNDGSYTLTVTFEALCRARHKASNAQSPIMRSPPPPAQGSRGRRV
jgi:multidrug efflux pump